MSEPIRLQKFFTDCGVLSRRAAEAEILAGRVKVNGRVALLGEKIDPEQDLVEYRGKRIILRTDTPKHTVMLNKPRGYVTTSKDEKGRHCVTELVRDMHTRLYPVGRLDMDSEGLLLLTDDGELANRLTHPRHQIPKIYHVTLSTSPTDAQLHALRAPMELDGYRLLPVRVSTISESELQMELFEGRNRQIRRMCDSVGLHITRLRRVAIGELTLESLPIGKWRELTEKEIAYLYQHTNPDSERK